MCFSVQAPCTRDTIFPDVLHSGAGKPRTLGAAAEEAIQAGDDDLRHLRSSRSPPATALLLLWEVVILGDFIVRHVRATLAEDKVHTHCFPGARVLDVSAQIPRSWKATRASKRSCCMWGRTTPSYGRRRHWRGTSGAWFRQYAAHHLRLRSSWYKNINLMQDQEKNLIVIKPGKYKINEQKQFLKLGLLNIRSLTPKAVIVN